MHFIVHWGPQSGNAVPAAPQNDLLQILKPYSWVRPLPNFYVVHVDTSDQYQWVSNGLNQAAQKYPNQIHLIVSPPMTAGTYTGFLPQNLWPQINERAR